MFQGEGTGSATVDGVTEGADGTVLGAVTVAASDAGTGFIAGGAVWAGCAGEEGNLGAVVSSRDLRGGGGGQHGGCWPCGG
jgi:hypothetical protein